MATITLEQAIQEADTAASAIKADPSDVRARARLDNIYKTSEWHSARYHAGRLSAVPEATLSSELDSWIVALEKNMDAMHDYSRVIGEYEYFMQDNGRDLETFNITSEYPVKIPALAIRRDAVKDLGWLMREAAHPKPRTLLEAFYATDRTTIPQHDHIGTTIRSGHTSSGYRFRSSPDFPTEPEGTDIYTPKRFISLIEDAGVELGHPRPWSGLRTAMNWALIVGIPIAGAAIYHYQHLK